MNYFNSTMKYLFLILFGCLLHFQSAYSQTQEDSLDVDTVAFYSDSLIFYDFISPNGDGVNDRFFVGYLDKFPKRIFQLMIYNIWGDMVYKNSDYRNEFEGKSNGLMLLMGNELPDGVYYYTLIDPLFVKHKGKLTIKR